MPPSLPPFLRVPRPGMMPPGGPRTPRFPGGPPRSSFRPGFLRGPPGRPPFPIRPGGGPSPPFFPRPTSRPSSRKSSLVDDQTKPNPLFEQMGSTRARRPSNHILTPPQSPPTWSPTRSGSLTTYSRGGDADIGPSVPLYDHTKPGGLPDLEEEYDWDQGGLGTITSYGGGCETSYGGGCESTPPSDALTQIDKTSSSLLQPTSSPQLHNDSLSNLSSVKRKSLSILSLGTRGFWVSMRL